MIKNVVIYAGAGLFVLLVCSLGVTFALGANQLEIAGRAYFAEQDDDSGDNDNLPIFPTEPPGADPGEYFVPEAGGQQEVGVEGQEFRDGDFYLTFCTTNSNNGNTDWSMSFSFINPTVHTWVNGRTQIRDWPPVDGGLDNQRFTFTSATVTPETLTTNQTATVRLNMRSQLGQADTQGSAIVVVTYDTPNGPFSTSIYIKYLARNSAECSLS